MIRRALLVLAAASASLAPAAAQPLSPRNANYTIDVRLDARARTLSAREQLVWTNVTSVPAHELQFHLYYNAWRNADSTWMREHRLTTWWRSAGGRGPGDFAAIDISSLTVAGGRYITDNVYLEIIGGGEEGGAVNVEWRVRRNVTVSSRVGGTGDTTLSIRWRRQSRQPGADREERRPARDR